MSLEKVHLSPEQRKRVDLFYSAARTLACGQVYVSHEVRSEEDLNNIQTALVNLFMNPVADNKRKQLSRERSYSTNTAVMREALPKLDMPPKETSECSLTVFRGDLVSEIGGRIFDWKEEYGSSFEPQRTHFLQTIGDMNPAVGVHGRDVLIAVSTMHEDSDPLYTHGTPVLNLGALGVRS
jgi:hypothetical protein